MDDPKQGGAGTAVPTLAPELEARIAALEAGASRSDFDRSSWLWMILFGIVVPVILLLIGWWA